ncbi:MAG: YbhB/YbcL family Raf kinase inhibitor-like protein [Elusimicrobia bacterium]|nr:YbhB/YbcL family Raf kinase inhibitor-like protein [Elusimicrobiota bacterium]MDE2236304.1 YbhB/YbcL family Raf kinase inhibitor-like protein [Elusimicrobiota bacterium]MDE2426020.1 YbhB/YbcL family Raf kinase inhibitor-like protein [Elusimicrobiota bacterium]
MKLTSPAFQNGGTIPKKYTCDGQDESPPLDWSGLPEGAKSLALIMDDPDAPMGVWVHWVLYDIAPQPASFAEGHCRGTSGRSWGVESFSSQAWRGPCPPPGKPHRYIFHLYALSAPTGLPSGATKAEVLRAIAGKTLAQAELAGLYGR